MNLSEKKTVLIENYASIRELLKEILRQLTYSLLILITKGVSLLPADKATNFGIVIGRLAFNLWEERKNVAIYNVKHVQEKGYLKEFDPHKLILSNFEEMGKTLVEVCFLIHGKAKDLFKRTRIYGDKNLKKAIKKKKGAIAITAHSGNWELMSLYISAHIKPLNVVARKIDADIVNKLVERMRLQFGQRIIYKKGAIRKIIKLLKQKQIIGMLVDQTVLPSDGMVVDFFKTPSWTLKSHAIIAKKMEAPVVPVFIKREKNNRHTIIFYPHINPKKEEKEILLLTNKIIERHIVKNPDQWLWIHKRWIRR